MQSRCLRGLAVLRGWVQQHVAHREARRRCFGSRPDLDLGRVVVSPVEVRGGARPIVVGGLRAWELVGGDGWRGRQGDGPRRRWTTLSKERLPEYRSL